MKTFAVLTLISIVALIFFVLGLNSDPAHSCADAYRSDVIACAADMQCQLADDEFLECFNK